MWARRAGWKEGTSRGRRSEEEAEAGRRGGSGVGDLIAAIEIEVEIAKGGVASAMMRKDHIGGTTESDRSSAITVIVARVLEATRGVGLLTILNIPGRRCENEAILHNRPAAARGLEIEALHSHSGTRRSPRRDIPLSHTTAGRGREIETVTASVGDDIY